MTDHYKPLIANILLAAGAVSGGAGLVQVDLWLGIILKVTGLVSFVCYMVLNWEKIFKTVKEWVKR